jgi:surfeit locus 1 family protein
VIKFNNQYFQFKPSLLGWIITLICIPLFIKFGLWQYGKAEMKMAIQDAYQASTQNSALTFPTDIITLDAPMKDKWEYKRVAVVGQYETAYQLLLDNQVEATRPGYHVITPLKITGTDQYVLVNRGWIPANDVHTDVPTVDTPSGNVKVEGQVWVPTNKIFTLEDKDVLAKKAFNTVWQHLDLKRYQKVVPIAVSALVIKLDNKSESGGFVRNWQVPVDRIATHMGYAYQWYGFAVATFLIFLYMSIVRVEE